MFRKENGYVLAIVVILVVIFITLGIAILSMSEREITTTRIDNDKTRAFYLAEAGLAKVQEMLQTPITGSITDLFEEPITQTLEHGNFRVQFMEVDSNYYAVSTGTSGNAQKRVRVKADFLATPFENAVYASNASAGNWAFQLRGTGNPAKSGDNEKGGKDTINGNIVMAGTLYMYDQSSVNKALSPNKYNLMGDVTTTGSINLSGSAKISGTQYPNSSVTNEFNLRAMNYAETCTHNVSQIFASITSGHTPAGSELRDIFMKNPTSDRNTECAGTTGNDYFLEPTTGFVLGLYNQGKTPVHLGNKRVYYIDGDLWIHSKQTYGFKVDGQATIVTTGNIHICDNIEYADNNSLLGLVALGKYDSDGKRISGGNIYFGDPVFGTMYVISAMMFAANDFLFNTDSVSGRSMEPTTGFTVNGNFAAMNQIALILNWYTPSSTSHHDRYSGSTHNSFSSPYNNTFHYGSFSDPPPATTTGAPTYYNPATSNWYDAETNVALSTTDKGTLRHYQMIINYDARVRDQATRPPSLPIGGSKIFSGFSTWSEL